MLPVNVCDLIVGISVLQYTNFHVQLVMYRGCHDAAVSRECIGKVYYGMHTNPVNDVPFLCMDVLNTT